jgi:hypothetical protein
MFDDKLKGVLDFAFDTRTEPKPVEPAATPQAHPAVLARSGPAP